MSPTERSQSWHPAYAAWMLIRHPNLFYERYGRPQAVWPHLLAVYGVLFVAESLLIMVASVFAVEWRLRLPLDRLWHEWLPTWSGYWLERMPQEFLTLALMTLMTFLLLELGIYLAKMRMTWQQALLCAVFHFIPPGLLNPFLGMLAAVLGQNNSVFLAGLILVQLTQLIWGVYLLALGIHRLGHAPWRTCWTLALSAMIMAMAVAYFAVSAVT